MTRLTQIKSRLEKSKESTHKECAFIRDFEMDIDYLLHHLEKAVEMARHNMVIFAIQTSQDETDIYDKSRDFLKGLEKDG